jgi:FixJ family two-component response regulator
MPLREPTIIAVVDNEASVRKALLRLFRAAGLKARAFASGPEFLGTLPSCGYSCLVLDLHMPGLTGFDVQNECMFADVRLPTIIITAHDEPGTRQKCLSAGAKAYFCKPFDDSELLEAIEEAVK